MFIYYIQYNFHLKLVTSKEAVEKRKNWKNKPVVTLGLLDLLFLAETANNQFSFHALKNWYESNQLLNPMTRYLLSFYFCCLWFLNTVITLFTVLLLVYDGYKLTCWRFKPQLTSGRQMVVVVIIEISREVRNAWVLAKQKRNLCKSTFKFQNKTDLKSVKVYFNIKKVIVWLQRI